MDKPRSPRTTPVPSDVLLDKTLQAPLLQTLCRLLALAWRHEYKCTDWLILDNLCWILGDDKPMERDTFFCRINQLKRYGWIRIIELRPNGKTCKLYLCNPRGSNSESMAEDNGA